MSLTELTKITSPGIKTDTNWVGNNAHFTGITTTDGSFNVGVTTIHSNLAEVHNVVSTGIITATQFKGDGSQLTGVTQSDTPLASSTASTVFYESDNETTVSTDTTLTRTSSNSGVIYTKFQQVVVAPTKSLIVAAGETFVVDAYGLRTPDI